MGRGSENPKGNRGGRGETAKRTHNAWENCRLESCRPHNEASMPRLQPTCALPISSEATPITSNHPRAASPITRTTGRGFLPPRLPLGALFTTAYSVTGRTKRSEG